MAGEGHSPHLPQQAPIDAYGNGGFRFAGMSHRGSILCLPSGIWTWSVAAPDGISETSLAMIFAAAGDVDHVLLGIGKESWSLPEELHWRLRDHGLAAETMTTGSAVRTYNILLGEHRRVAAALIAVS